jgi:UDP-2,3-diacylglucosamine pyrophosphatase LpxH
MVSFLHTADLHLDSDHTVFNKTLYDVQLAILRSILEEANSLKVDFVLIAGDLFDGHLKGRFSKLTMDYVDPVAAKQIFDILNSSFTPVYILPGNHDSAERDHWNQPPWNVVDPKKVRVMRTMEPVYAASDAVLSPCPYRPKTTQTDLESWYRSVPQTESMVRIGVAHGNLRFGAHMLDDYFRISHDAVATMGIDYLALGHVHKLRLFSGPDKVIRVAYPGTPVPIGHLTSWYLMYHRDYQRFRYSRRGRVLHVRIDGPGADPVVDTIDVGFDHSAGPRNHTPTKKMKRAPLSAPTNRRHRPIWNDPDFGTLLQARREGNSEDAVRILGLLTRRYGARKVELALKAS